MLWCHSVTLVWCCDVTVRCYDITVWLMYEAVNVMLVWWCVAISVTLWHHKVILVLFYFIPLWCLNDNVLSQCDACIILWCHSNACVMIKCHSTMHVCFCDITLCSLCECTVMPQGRHTCLKNRLQDYSSSYQMHCSQCFQWHRLHQRSIVKNLLDL